MLKSLSLKPKALLHKPAKTGDREKKSTEKANPVKKKPDVFQTGEKTDSAVEAQDELKFLIGGHDAGNENKALVSNVSFDKLPNSPKLHQEPNRPDDADRKTVPDDLSPNLCEPEVASPKKNLPSLGKIKPKGSLLSQLMHKPVIKKPSAPEKPKLPSSPQVESSKILKEFCGNNEAQIGTQESLTVSTPVLATSEEPAEDGSCSVIATTQQQVLLATPNHFVLPAVALEHGKDQELTKKKVKIHDNLEMPSGSEMEEGRKHSAHKRKRSQRSPEKSYMEVEEYFDSDDEEDQKKKKRNKRRSVNPLFTRFYEREESFRSKLAEQGQDDIDPTQLPLSDLCFYTPQYIDKLKPLLEEKKKKLALKKQKQKEALEAGEAPLSEPVPQPISKLQTPEEAEPPEKSGGVRVTVDEDGNFIVDTESLVIETAEAAAERRALDQQAVLHDAGNSAYNRFGKLKPKKNRVSFSAKNTAKFYTALSLIGPNFDKMTQFFPHLSRDNLKNKFKSEDKKNPGFITDLLSRVKFDVETYHQILDSSSDEENEEVASLKDAKQIKKEKLTEKKKIKEEKKKQKEEKQKIKEEKPKEEKKRSSKAESPEEGQQKSRKSKLDSFRKPQSGQTSFADYTPNGKLKPMNIQSVESVINSVAIYRPSLSVGDEEGENTLTEHEFQIHLNNEEELVMEPLSQTVTVTSWSETVEHESSREQSFYKKEINDFSVSFTSDPPVDRCASIGTSCAVENEASLESEIERARMEDLLKTVEGAENASSGDKEYIIPEMCPIKWKAETGQTELSAVVTTISEKLPVVGITDKTSNVLGDRKIRIKPISPRTETPHQETLIVGQSISNASWGEGYIIPDICLIERDAEKGQAELSAVVTTDSGKLPSVTDKTSNMLGDRKTRIRPISPRTGTSVIPQLAVTCNEDRTLDSGQSEDVCHTLNLELTTGCGKISDTLPTVDREKKQPEAKRCVENVTSKLSTKPGGFKGGLLKSLSAKPLGAKKKKSKEGARPGKEAEPVVSAASVKDSGRTGLGADASLGVNSQLSGFRIPKLKGMGSSVSDSAPEPKRDAATPTLVRSAREVLYSVTPSDESLLCTSQTESRKQLALLDVSDGSSKSVITNANVKKGSLLKSSLESLSKTPSTIVESSANSQKQHPVPVLHRVVPRLPLGRSPVITSKIAMAKPSRITQFEDSGSSSESDSDFTRTNSQPPVPVSEPSKTSEFISNDARTLDQSPKCDSTEAFVPSSLLSDPSESRDLAPCILPRQNDFAGCVAGTVVSEDIKDTWTKTAGLGLTRDSFPETSALAVGPVTEGGSTAEVVVHDAVAVLGSDKLAALSQVQGGSLVAIEVPDPNAPSGKAFQVFWKPAT